MFLDDKSTHDAWCVGERIGDLAPCKDLIVLYQVDEHPCFVSVIPFCYPDARIQLADIVGLTGLILSLLALAALNCFIKTRFIALRSAVAAAR